jgi:restriction endonuclease S subunit
VENDGFDLGAQRRAFDKNDLPAAQTLMQAWQQAVAEKGGEGFDMTPYAGVSALLVEKSRVAENGEYNLTSERYMVEKSKELQKHPIALLSEICDINPEAGNPYELFGDSNFVYIDITSVENGTGKISYENVLSTKEAPSRARRFIQENDVLLSTVRPNLKAFTILKNLPSKVIASTGFAVLRTRDSILPEFLYQVIKNDNSVNQMISMMGKGAYPSINQSDVASIKIPLPPLEVQHEIVAEIEGYQRIIDGARMVVENWKPNIELELEEARKEAGVEEWEMVKLGEVCENLDSLRRPVTKSDRKNGKYPYYGASGIVDYVDDYIFDGDYLLISEDGANLLARSTPIAFSITGKTWVNNHAHVLKFTNKISQHYVEFIINSMDISLYVTGSAQPKLNQKSLNSISLPFPPLKIQKLIVDNIFLEKEMIKINQKLLSSFQEKILSKINQIYTG